MKKLLAALIVAFAIAAAIPSTRGQMRDALSPILDGARAKMVPGRLEAIADQLDGLLANGRPLPGDFQDWLVREYTGGPAQDAWGNYFYLDARRRGGYTVGSLGPDGERGTGDDITLQRGSS